MTRDACISWSKSLVGFGIYATLLIRPNVSGPRKMSYRRHTVYKSQRHSNNYNEGNCVHGRILGWGGRGAGREDHFHSNWGAHFASSTRELDCRLQFAAHRMLLFRLARPVRTDKRVSLGSVGKLIWSSDQLKHNSLETFVTFGGDSLVQSNSTVRGSLRRGLRSSGWRIPSAEL